MKDNNKICFISCVNNAAKYEECLKYIMALDIPDNYTIETISIIEANCMTEGYNAGMKDTDAKYKVYLHQDVFIINKNFIHDIIKLFMENEKIGLIGICGSKTIPEDAHWRNSSCRIGKVYKNYTGNMEVLTFNEVNNEYETVMALDGLIMATQYDLTWREDIFNGWYLYDLSQTLEFINAGYEVVVPRQEEPWCIHDCGIIKIGDEFQCYSNVFLENYSKTIDKLTEKRKNYKEPEMKNQNNNRKKNIVFVHLESLSSLTFNQYKNEMPALTNIMGQSITFENFYSTATSTLMAMKDLFHGNDFEMDNSVSIGDIAEANLDDNIFDVLYENEYKTLGITYPMPFEDAINERNIWSGLENKLIYKNDYNDFIDNIDNHIKNSGINNKPFALYVWDIRSHLEYSDLSKAKGENSLERIQLGYSCIDNTLGLLIKVLKENNVFDNTIIVGFGDHGDDYWTHGINCGLSHSIQPYTNIVATPAFIFDSQIQPTVNKDLVCLTDLKSSILFLLGIEHESKFIHSGKNIFLENNKYVFSRNLLANQKNHSSVEGLKKAYSITSKDYHLIVSDSGLEMYAHKMDPTNHNNLLSFFNFSNEGEIIFTKRGAMHTHFTNFMGADQIEDIYINFILMYQKLKERVLVKNNFITTHEKNLFDMLNFRKVKERNFMW